MWDALRMQLNENLQKMWEIINDLCVCILFPGKDIAEKCEIMFLLLFWMTAVARGKKRNVAVIGTRQRNL